MKNKKRNLILLVIALITGFAAYYLFPRVIETVNEGKINSNIIMQIRVTGMILLEYFLIAVSLISFVGIFQKLKPHKDLGLWSTMEAATMGLFVVAIGMHLIFKNTTFTSMLFHIAPVALMVGFILGVITEFRE